MRLLPLLRAAVVLAAADRDWLDGLATRRVPLTGFTSAFEHGPARSRPCSTWSCEVLEGWRWVAPPAAPRRCAPSPDHCTRGVFAGRRPNLLSIKMSAWS